jgi:hypothetical protein
MKICYRVCEYHRHRVQEIHYSDARFIGFIAEIETSIEKLNNSTEFIQQIGSVFELFMREVRKLC